MSSPEEIREALAYFPGPINGYANTNEDAAVLDVIEDAARAYADLLEKAEPGRAIGVIFDDDWGLTADEDALVLAVPSHAWSTNPGRYLVVPVETCPVCEGTGEIYGKGAAVPESLMTCRHCHGTGRVPVEGGNE